VPALNRLRELDSDRRAAAADHPPAADPGAQDPDAPGAAR
jgi:hypothetical protein